MWLKYVIKGICQNTFKILFHLIVLPLQKLSYFFLHFTHFSQTHRHTPIQLPFTLLT